MGLGRWLTGLSASLTAGGLIPHPHKSLWSSRVASSSNLSTWAVGGVEIGGPWTQASSIGDFLVQ